MIESKKELEFYIKADRMMNRGVFKKSILQCLHELITPDIIMEYLISMRKLSFYTPPRNKSDLYRNYNFLKRLKYIYYKRKFYKLGLKLGYSIGPHCFGYGLTLHHYGSIVVGDDNRIGNYALINTSTCITNNGSKIGNFFFMGTGAKVIKKVELGDNIILGANSVVLSSIPKDNCLLTGVPAIIKKENSGSWYESIYGSSWKKKHDAIEALRQSMFIVPNNM